MVSRIPPDPLADTALGDLTMRSTYIEEETLDLSTLEVDVDPATDGVDPRYNISSVFGTSF